MGVGGSRRASRRFTGDSGIAYAGAASVSTFASASSIPASTDSVLDPDASSNPDTRSLDGGVVGSSSSTSSSGQTVETAGNVFKSYSNVDISLLQGKEAEEASAKSRKRKVPEEEGKEEVEMQRIKSCQPERIG